MDPTITIRRVQAGDAQALYEYYERLSPASKRTFAPFGPQPTLAQYEEVVRDNNPESGSKYDLVAVAGDRLVGKLPFAKVKLVAGLFLHLL